ncbi:MAG: tetratricopeptide repeat protein [Treponema sp.]|nr:tetratricopeptide repeat protein [Treponema sp.]
MSNFIPNHSESRDEQAERTSAAIEYLRQGRNAEAYLIFSEPETVKKTEKDPAARFAMGLCYFRTGELTAAISCFEQALNLLRVMSPGKGTLSPSQPAAEKSETYLKLAAEEIADKTYLTPMDADFCMLFPKAAENAVLLALIDAYKQNGMIEQARRLSASLTGPIFEAYKGKL